MLNQSSGAKKGSARWVIVLSAVLIGYTAYRTMELMSLTLPPDNWWAGLFALAGLDGGVFLWTKFYLDEASGPDQEGIAKFMAGLDMVGITFSMFGDVFYQASKKDFNIAKPDIVFWAIVVQGAVIVGNAAAGILVIMTSPAAKEQLAERRFLHAQEDQRLRQKQKHRELELEQEDAKFEAYAQIEREKNKVFKENAPLLGKEAAAIEGQRYLNEQRSQYSFRETHQAPPDRLPAPQQPVTAPLQPIPPLRHAVTFSADGGGDQEETTSPN